MNTLILKAVAALATGAGLVTLSKQSSASNNDTTADNNEPTTAPEEPVAEEVPIVEVPTQTQQVVEQLDDKATQTIDTGDGEAVTAPAQAATETAANVAEEDKRLRPLYMGDPNAAYDPFYDWTDDDQMMYSDEGKDGFKYYTSDPTSVLHMRIVRPLVATEKTTIGRKCNPDTYTWYNGELIHLGADNWRYNSWKEDFLCNHDAIKYYSFVRGDGARNVQLLVEIANPTELDINLKRFVVDNISIAGKPCQVFSPRLKTLSSAQADAEDSDRLAQMRSLPLEVIPFKYAKSSVYYYVNGCVPREEFLKGQDYKLREFQGASTPAQKKAMIDTAKYTDASNVYQFEVIPANSCGLYVLTLPLLVTDVKTRLFARPFREYNKWDKPDMWQAHKHLSPITITRTTNPATVIPSLVNSNQSNQTFTISKDEDWYLSQNFKPEAIPYISAIDQHDYREADGTAPTQHNIKDFYNALERILGDRTEDGRLQGIAFFDFKCPEFRPGDEISLRVRAYDDLNEYEVNTFDMIKFGSVRMHYLSLRSGLVNAKTELPKDSSVFISYYDNRTDLPLQTGTMQDNWKTLQNELNMPEQTCFDNYKLSWEDKITLCSNFKEIPSAWTFATAVLGCTTSPDEAYNLTMESKQIFQPDDKEVKLWLADFVMAACCLRYNVEPREEQRVTLKQGLLNLLYEMGISSTLQRVFPYWKLRDVAAVANSAHPHYFFEEELTPAQKHKLLVERDSNLGLHDWIVGFYPKMLRDELAVALKAWKLSN